MESYSDCGLQLYEEAGSKSDRLSGELKRMVAGVSARAMLENAGDIVRGWKELQAINIQSRTYLAQLSMKYDHDSEKFRKILQGAERRLDRQLDELSDMRRTLMTMSVSSSNADELRSQRMLLEMIAEAQKSFNHEIDRLYDL